MKEKLNKIKIEEKKEKLKKINNTRSKQSSRKQTIVEKVKNITKTL